jgi:hypothetical protein
VTEFWNVDVLGGVLLEPDVYSDWALFRRWNSGALASISVNQIPVAGKRGRVDEPFSSDPGVLAVLW